MARNLVCSECGGTMQKGFVEDVSYGDTLPASWVEGKPEKGYLTRKLTDKTHHYIAAYRCEKCGLLKFYAGPDNSESKE